MAAPSDVQMCNRALARLGEDPIASLDDTNSDVARHCGLIYEDAVRELLVSHPWNFAVIRQELVQIAEPPGPPVFAFVHAYALPTDPLCLRALDTNADLSWGSTYAWPPQPSALWQIETLGEQTVLVTDEEPMSLRYIGYVADAARMSAPFRRALVAELAAQLSYAIQRKAEQTDALTQQARRILGWAKSMNGQEGRRGNYISSALIDVRF